MCQLAQQLVNVSIGGTSFEMARDVVRRSMHALNPVSFPYGPNTTSIDRIMNVLLPVDQTHGAVGLERGRFLYSKLLSFDVGGVMQAMKLRGIIYGGGSHFTASSQQYLACSVALFLILTIKVLNMCIRLNTARSGPLLEPRRSTT
ncbi:hypothetical protein B0H16DRAFT_1454512 [Mycena metata]|uniref:Uncharacterized protein n=1 Tax=Mycena metata TaxID=1033252 RepID=A0AAD7JKQ5_9AGAR|nr:hypothetical protein B0H16DRAFT_1454512 [Mycena metata]